MAQVKIHGLRAQLAPRRAAVSDCIHACTTEVLGLPADKRFHRFFLFDREDFVAPARSDAYTIIEILLMSGRTLETRKRLVRRIFEGFEADLGIAPQDVEITLIESESANWGFRGIGAENTVKRHRAAEQWLRIKARRRSLGGPQARRCNAEPGPLLRSPSGWPLKGAFAALLASSRRPALTSARALRRPPSRANAHDVSLCFRLPGDEAQLNYAIKV